MPNDNPVLVRTLPERADLRHLRDEAKARVRAGNSSTLAQAQFSIARSYGFASWPKLKSHIELLQAEARETAALKLAIDEENFAEVKAMMTRNPALHRAPLGYGKNGPLTWVAECRVPWRPPTQTRLDMAQWMIDHGSDVHQGADGPLMRAALNSMRVPMMELLVRNGADVNAEWSGYFPIIFAPCETVELIPLRWLLEHGANPNCEREGRKYPDSALDYVIGTYSRSEQLSACIDTLLEYGARSRRDIPVVLDMLRGQLDKFEEHLTRDPSLVSQRFADLDFGSSGARRLTLRGATLLHVAAEYGSVDAARILIAHGADVNASALVDDEGVGGQTPIFHAATQFFDWGAGVIRLLIERGADLSISARLPGHYEIPDEVIEGTVLGYARRFPGHENGCVALLEQAGAV